jgi:hypothetical protein
MNNLTYKILDSLTPTQITNLLDLQSNVKMVPAVGTRRRIGVHGINNLSVYNYSRYLTWTSAQRKLFSDNYPTNADSKAFIKWFVEFPANTGFLDRLETWKEDKSPSWYTCYNIRGAGSITLDGVEITVPVGQGISYPLSIPHEMKVTTTGALWACVVTMDNVWA